MPGLDVSFMTSDPMLSDTFRVTRRLDSVNSHGRTTPTPSEVYEGVVGVVTQDSVKELMRTPDAQSVPWRIFVASTFAFRGASTGNQPDIITWNCIDFTVVKVLPYSRFGNGTYEVIAESMHATDRADDNKGDG